MANSPTRGRLETRLAKLEAGSASSLKPFLRIICDAEAGEDVRATLRAEALRERFGDGPYPEVDWIDVNLVGPKVEPRDG